jgi:hypothetical protein
MVMCTSRRGLLPQVLFLKLKRFQRKIYLRIRADVQLFANRRPATRNLMSVGLPIPHSSPGNLIGTILGNGA